jgi:hypothetical protein
MPRLDIILLPLLGGYIFLITFNYTKFYHKRIEKNRLIYNSLLFAFVLTGFVYIIDYLFIKGNEYYLEFLCLKSKSINSYRNLISTTIDNIIHFSKPGFKQSLLVFLISYPLAKALNFIKYFHKDFSFDYTLNKWGNEYEKIIWNTLGENEDLDKLLMITTKSNKVYIGQVTKLSEPIENTHIRILPSLSGYREKETQNLIITTNYTNIIQVASIEDNTEILDSKLGVIIPISEIILISRFDYQIFGQFNSADEDSDIEGQQI